ncbi:DUF4288 domain-containing protein [Anaerolineales bacterium HSG25]|nr:DUF4288 domain-containing protein [Anaerolineales bacterium HSG25]
MAWYTAHAIMYVKFKDGNQDKYPFWENIILIEATSSDEAFEKAEQRAKEDEGDSRGSFTHEGRPAIRLFAGLRRLVSCVDAEERPNHGTELTYSEMEVTSKADFEKLVNGESVMVLYE